MAKLVKVTHPDWEGFQELTKEHFERIVLKDSRFEIVTGRKKSKNAITKNIGNTGTSRQSEKQAADNDCGCP